MFSILNKAWVQAESATPPSVTTGAPKWAKAPFYSDLVPSGSRQFASRFRPRNQKVRNLYKYYIINQARTAVAVLA